MAETAYKRYENLLMNQFSVTIKSGLGTCLMTPFLTFRFRGICMGVDHGGTGDKSIRIWSRRL